MRPIIVLAILGLGLGSASPEPEYSSVAADALLTADGALVPSLVEIESATDKADRLDVVALRTGESVDEILSDRPLPAKIVAIDELLNVQSTKPAKTINVASAEADIDLPLDIAETDEDAGLHHAPAPTDVDTETPSATSMGDLCNVVMTSAQDNDLPVPFFANLLWQESGLRNDIVSRKGALGIAQFMPETAAESGLENPFDPLKAIPASAKLLHALRDQFGNLGFVAAAYNAGAHRVAEWLERRRGLPRETRDYVANITGRSVEQWRKTPPDGAALKFVRRLPCRQLAAFADLEQAQQEQAQRDQAQADQANAGQTKAETDKVPQETAELDHSGARHVVFRRHPRPHARHDDVHTATRTVHFGKRQVEHAAHDRHRSV
jgi:hypothetical protein